MVKEFKVKLRVAGFEEHQEFTVTIGGQSESTEVAELVEKAFSEVKGYVLSSATSTYRSNKTVHLVSFDGD